MTTVHSKRMPTTERAPHGTRLRRCICMTVVAATMIRCAQSHANDSPGSAARDGSADESTFHRTFDRTTDLNAFSFLKTPVTAPRFSAPYFDDRQLELSAPQLTEPSSYSQLEFRPRGHSIFDTQASLTGYDTPNSMRSNPTVWQQMRDYRGHGRVRVLTLWESTGGTVSLQAGKGGSPSLQWTSSWMSRGDAKRGVLDSLFAVSLAGAANTIRNVTRSGLPQGQGARDSTKLAAAAAGPTAR